MQAQDHNPYSSPKATDTPAGPRKKGGTRWVPKTLGMWTLTFFVVANACVVAGFLHYDWLSRDFDYRNGSSEELSRMTSAVGYWLIPTLISLGMSVLLGSAVIVKFLIRLFRGQ